MPTSASGGFTGKVLKVDLTSRTISSQDTFAVYGDYWGGAGMGYKAIWDNMVTGTKYNDEKNALTIGYGPLTGTAAPCNGRTCVTALTPVNLFNGPTSGHLGGYFGPECKYAGWDGIVVVGKAEKPCWIKIIDDKVEIVDAPELWGTGMHRTWVELTEAMGCKSAQVLACGTAGQNEVPQSCNMNGRSHSGGSVGAVWGAKKLLGIGVVGTGSIKIACGKAKWRTLIEYAMYIVASNNNASVPNTPQPWSEFVSGSGTRWWASKGRFWGAAAPAIELGTAEPHDRQSVGYRCWKVKEGPGADFAGDVAVRMDGCHACPIRCHALFKIPSAEKWGASQYDSNTCSGYSSSGILMDSAKFATVDGSKGKNVAVSAFDAALRKSENYVVANQMANDLGVTFNYGLGNGWWTWLYDGKGANKKPGSSNTYGPGELYIKPNVSAAEWTYLQKGLFDLFERGDLRFNAEFGRLMSTPKGSPLWPPSALGEALGACFEWHLDNWVDAEGNSLRKNWNAQKTVSGKLVRADNAGPANYWKMGHPEHHTSSIVGLMLQAQYNRDTQQHQWSIPVGGSGLPLDIQVKNFESQWKKYYGDFTPAPADGTGFGYAHDSRTDIEIHEIHARAAKFAHARKELGNGLGLCGWMYPWFHSALKERGYEGDIGLECKYFNAVTGLNFTVPDLDKEAERWWILHRAITMRQMKAWGKGYNNCARNGEPGVFPPATGVKGGSANMKEYHDHMSSMEPQEVLNLEWPHLMNLWYAEWGLDPETGWPTSATYTKYNMGAVATVMAAESLMP